MKKTPLASYLLSRTLEELGDHKEAEAILKKALEKDPDVILTARIAASQPRSTGGDDE